MRSHSSCSFLPFFPSFYRCFVPGICPSFFSASVRKNGPPAPLPHWFCAFSRVLGRRCAFCPGDRQLRQVMVKNISNRRLVTPIWAVKMKPPEKPPVFVMGSIYQGNSFWGCPFFDPQAFEMRGARVSGAQKKPRLQQMPQASKVLGAQRSWLVFRLLLGLGFS